MDIQTETTRKAPALQITTRPRELPMGKILKRSRAILLILIYLIGVGIFWPYSYRSPFQMVSARVTFLEEVIKNPSVTNNEWVIKYIEPYNWYKVNNRSEPADPKAGIVGHENLDPLGLIELVGSTISKTSFFACTFGFYSRNRSQVSIETQRTYHSLRLVSHGVAGKIVNQEYQFNLNHLSPKVNPFDPRRRTIILIPGFRSGDYVEWMHHIKNTWLELEDVNVILVHWSEGSGGLYESAVKNTRIVSRQITILLYYLAQWHDVDFKDEEFRRSIYLVGHSCGAHIASYVGQELGGQVARITGLDPAGPIFESMENPRHRLSPQDAELVDIIHTNAGTMSRYYHIGVGLLKKAAAMVKKKIGSSDNLDNQQTLPKWQPEVNLNQATPWYGINQQIGHIDYYVNGGSVQPGCSDELHVCDHNRAVDVYLGTLEYEVAARNAYDRDSETIRRGLHRLMGFKAKDHNELRSGASIMLNCPNLIVSDLLKNDSEELENSYKLCTIPLDFATPIEKLKKELAQEYGVKFDYSSPLKNDEHAPAPKYYFDTLSEKPFVSDTYLFRIHLDQESPVGWRTGCQFLSHISSADRRQKLHSTIDYTPKFTLPHHVGKFYGVALPVPNPNDWRLSFPSRRKIIDKLNCLTNRNKKRCFARIRKLLPSILSVGVSFTSQQTEGFLARRLDAITSIWSSKPTTDLKTDMSETCSFRYTAFELRPLSRALNNSFSLWFSDNIPADKGQIPEVRNHSQLVHKAVERLDEPRKVNLNHQFERMGLVEIGLN